MDLSHILHTKYTDSQILCFYRKDKAGGRMYRNLVNSFCQQYLDCTDPQTISEYRGSANIYIDLKKYDISDYSNEDLEIFHETIQVQDIRRTERYFRTYLGYYEAYDLIVSCTKFFIELFKTGQYKIIVAQIVDNYVMDIMVRVANYYKIDVVGVVRFFYPGYIRITIKGEHNYLREPSNEEVDVVFGKLVSKERTVYNVSKLPVYKEFVRQYFVYKVKYMLHYLCYHKLLGGREYDYASTPSQEYPKDVRNLFVSRFFERNLDAIAKLNIHKNVYLPLHFYPEATVEYWVDDYKISPYYPSLFETVRQLSNLGFNVIIKEHPAFYLKRKTSVYKVLKSIDNVYLVNPFISTYDVIDKADFTIVWTGTSGIEALMQNKKVLVASENYYSNGKLKRVTNIAEAKAFNDIEKKEMLHHIMSNCLPLNIKAT